MVSKANDDLPLPLKPVMTTSLLRGIVTSIFLRLWTRAPYISNWSSCNVIFKNQQLAKVEKREAESMLAHSLKFNYDIKNNKTGERLFNLLVLAFIKDSLHSSFQLQTNKKRKQRKRKKIFFFNCPIFFRIEES